MAVNSTGSSSLDQITTSYQSNATQTSQTEDALGLDSFLTMLVAQLENQDPLNPMDGTDFSAQLAQFSQLEQLINLNSTMENMAEAFNQNSEGDVVSLVGKQVTADVDVMNVDSGIVSGGFYNLTQPANVMVTISDAEGKTVKTLFEGQQASGSHVISWDGTDNSGNSVESGSYKYTVLANTGSGYVEVPSSVTGTVDGITYNNGKAYLVVQGVLVDPSSLTAVSGQGQQDEAGEVDSTLDYLGKTISSNSPIILVDEGSVQGNELTFDLNKQEPVTINIYDAYDELVKTITLPSDETSSGTNSIAWDGVTNSGYHAANGLYYYTVKGEDGFASISVSDEVNGIKYMNNSQYLVLEDSGRLVALSGITGIDL